MESNARISVHRSSESLHLKLLGDFDDSLASELLEVLEKNSFRVHRVFIHTSSLTNIHSFGRDMFHKNLSHLNGHAIRILFTGENASRIAPEKGLCM
jgi:hypothetical protein